MPIRVVVWNEYLHEVENDAVRAIYPDGLHRTIADALSKDPDIDVSTATLREPEHGLPKQRLDETDVLLWWGHKAHSEVSDAVVERVQQRVFEGLGLIVLHSGHFSKLFKRLMGAPCALRWREAGERERLWVIDPSHPIAAGIGPAIELANSEMYGEPFLVPEPLQTVFVSWFEGGEVFRSGLTFQRGAGRIFYFAPGHETYPIYHHPQVRQVLLNAVRWSHNPAPAWQDVSNAPNVPVEAAREPLTRKGASLQDPSGSVQPT